MGCKTPKTSGSSMHCYKNFCLVCFIQINCLLAFSHLDYFYCPYLICKCTHTCRNSSHSTILFHLEQLSAVVFWCAGVQGHVQIIKCRRLPSESLCVCFCSNSSLKPLGQLKPHFMWNHHGIAEESLVK